MAACSCLPNRARHRLLGLGSSKQHRALCTAQKHPRTTLCVPRKAQHRDDLPPDDLQETQEIITFYTQDGIVRIPGRVLYTQKELKKWQRMPTWEEQGLCIGASFYLAATNGYDPARRINFEGFCQSIDYLYESVEDTVRSRGGEVLLEQRELKSGVHEILKVTVAVPSLWGVPPQLDAINSAIRLGGGIIHRSYHEWGMYKL